MSSASNAPFISVTLQQTRFHIHEDNASTEIHIKDLTIAVSSTSSAASLPASELKAKGKAKAKTEELEILSRAELRLKMGVHYALIGRNGTGKSTLLRAIAEKLIPGIPLSTRISLLQQTSQDLEDEPAKGKEMNPQLSKKPVLQYIVESDTTRNKVLHEVDVLSKGIESNDQPLATVRAIRHVEHARMEDELFEAQKDAKLRSGARGYDSRKYLTAFEKKLEEATARLDQEDSEISDEAVTEETQRAVDLLAALQAQLESMQVSDIETKARTILHGLGFKEPQYQKPFNTLSGGWRMRCLLACALTHPSDIILLDEPTNYLDLLGIIWLERYLQNLAETSDATIVMVSHDRAFIDAICSELITLADQKLSYFGGNLSAYEKDKKHQTLRFTRMQEAQDKQKEHMEQTIKNNRKNYKKTGDENRIRQAKSREKRLADRQGLTVNANGGRFKLNRDLEGYHLTARAAIDIPKAEREVSMAFPPAPDLRFPGSLVSLENVSFTYPKAPKPALQDINLVVHMGDRIGIVGLNGSGKSTLIRLLADQTKPTKGTITRHPRAKLGYYDQHHVEELQELGHREPKLTAVGHVMQLAASQVPAGPDELGSSAAAMEHASRALLSSVGLSGATAAATPIAKLSGGQLVRLGLALIIGLSPPHILVLDEISTHLDFYTVTALVGALDAYEGAVVLVSHDRWLIRGVVEGEKEQFSDSEDEGGGSSGEEEDQRRRTVFQIKGGKMLERKGVGGFEADLEGRLKRMGI